MTSFTLIYKRGWLTKVVFSNIALHCKHIAIDVQTVRVTDYWRHTLHRVCDMRVQILIAENNETRGTFACRHDMQIHLNHSSSLYHVEIRKAVGNDMNSD